MDLVTSDSMTPTLMEGDVVAWTPTNIEDVKIGDVIVFKSYVHWPDEKIVVHRISDLRHNSRGEILLETKGDKNEWTDQAGPHIPEPFIREEHLMGKVLSIGQLPLKIPFIGYIGVWVNQGLNVLSQPSSSKGSLDYIGIFAPLTISIVILVVLIFLLPEKAKTFKEKIRMNILGRKPLNMKRTLVSFFIAYIVFLTVIHCFAYDTISTSVGINENSEDSGLDFEKLGIDVESEPKDLPLINPSTMPVKGIVFAKGEMSEFVERKTFQLERGETSIAPIKAKTSKDSKNGSYKGDLMVYSSPFWLIFPDEFIEAIVNLNAEVTVFILDFLSATILTTLTVLSLISITFAGDKIVIWSINRSWQHPSRLIFKRKTIDKVDKAKKNIKHKFKRNIWWILKVDIFENKFKEGFFPYVGKPIIAALIILPLFFLLEDQILTMFIAVLISGFFAYLISCKIRNKVILTVLISMIIAASFMILTSNITILTQEHETVEYMALSLGTIGVFLLVFAILIIPLSLLSWAILHFIRNVKEQKDPLLSLEGRCDL